jgi:hypothetical protein
VKVCCFPDQKPCITSEVGAKLKDQATAYKAFTDNPEATAEDRNKKSHYDLRRVIKLTK